ncbi:tetratricopeptide repeat protein [Striga asiatica]|uniref:Tetratricopeptide repeat protein n=1 Tax=Striga asiatica TaxID=4170 RepID=A0A5A7PVQ6_STRAF|nr:tetratricopeptide repeat protein [Striga asiatica]
MISIIIIIFSNGDLFVPFGKLLRSPGLQLPIRPDQNHHHRHHTRGLGRQKPKPQAFKFPNSQSPITGKTIDVSAIISSSRVNIPAHTFLTETAKNRADIPSPKLHASPTIAASFALSGLRAPISFPTLVETPKLRDDGKI